MRSFPEVDRGALGAATHLARLVPQHKMRAMVYTATTATAAELHHFGSVLKVVEPDELRPAALEVARQIATKSTTIIRAAKESLNGIDLWDVKKSYRFEQGFTFELNLSGVSELVEAGHEVFIHEGAGVGSTIPDEEYVAQGARMVQVMAPSPAARRGLAR